MKTAPTLSINRLVYQGHPLATVMEEISQLNVEYVELAFIKTYCPELSVDSFKRRMVFAKEMGASMIISNASHRAFEVSFFKNIESLTQFAQSLSLLIGLESPGDGADHIIEDATTGALTIQKIGSDLVRLNDIGNPSIYSKGTARPEEDLEEAIPWSAILKMSRRMSLVILILRLERG